MVLRRSVAVLCATMLALAAHMPYPARAGEPPYFAIRGARVVTVSGAVIEDGTVVISNGLIAAVGKDVSIPPEAWVIDGKGLTVYPGLIDAMTSVGLGAPPEPARGAPGAGPPAGQPTPPRRPSMGPEDRPATTPWLNAADELKTDDNRLESWRNGGFTTVLAAPSQGIFPGQGAVVNTAGERPVDMVVKAPATLQVTFTSPGGFFGFPGALMGTLAYIRQVLHDTAHYAQTGQAYEQSPRGKERPQYDRTVRVINAAMRAGRPVLLPGNTAPEMLRAVTLADEFQLKAVLYGGQQGYQIAEQLAAKKYPVLVSLKWPEKPKDADPEADEPLSSMRFRDRAPSTPAALSKAGVKFAFYSGGVATPKEILKNAKKAIDAGLSAEAALRALTLDAAEILGVSDRLGSIEPGKIANLVVTDGDLFDEKTKVKFVFVDGRKYEVREPERPSEKPAVNVTGKWSLTVNTPQGPQESTADLTMAEDGTLSGSVTGQRGTAAITSGWVSGNKLSFTVSLTMGPRTVEATYAGTVEGNTMKGTVSFGPVSAEFTGTRPGSGAGAEGGEL